MVSAAILFEVDIMPCRLLPMLCTVILAFLLAAKLMLADSCPAETERTRAKPETVDSLDCSFDQGVCKWKPENMQTTGNFVEKGLTIGPLNSTGKCLVVVRTNTMSSLKSELVEDTNGSTVCMEFAYIVTGVNAQLSVYTSPEGSTETRQLWSYLSVSYSNSSEWKFAAVPLRTCLAFQVVLKTLPTNDERAAIAIDNIKFRRNGGATCSGDGASEDSVNAGAIAGSMTAVIFVSIIALVIGIILWRRRFGGGMSLDAAKEDSVPASSRELADSLHHEHHDQPGPPTDCSSDHISPCYVNVTQIINNLLYKTESHYEHHAEPRPPSDYSSLQGNIRVPQTLPSYYNGVQDAKTLQHKTEPQYEHLGQPSPPSDYSSLQGEVPISQTSSLYYDAAQYTSNTYN